MKGPGFSVNLQLRSPQDRRFWCSRYSAQGCQLKRGIPRQYCQWCSERDHNIHEQVRIIQKEKKGKGLDWFICLAFSKGLRCSFATGFIFTINMEDLCLGKPAKQDAEPKECFPCGCRGCARVPSEPSEPTACPGHSAALPFHDSYSSVGKVS